MMNWLWRFVFVVCLTNPILLFAQYSKSNLVAAEFSGQTANAPSDQITLADYCDRELFVKLNDRPYQINGLANQGQSFELWADSLSRRFMVLIDIPEEGWVTEHQLSIPLIFNRYQKNYLIEAYVKIYRKFSDKPALTKKYLIKINGRKTYQVCQNNPNDNGLVVPFKERFLKEKQAHMRLAAQLANDIYSIINNATAETTGESNVPKG
jgi:hypothetical protein